MKRALAVPVALALALAMPGAAGAQSISLDVRDAAMGDVVALLAAQTGRNIVCEGAPTGRVTLHLSNVPFEDALDVVARAGGLQIRKQGNILVLAPAADSQGGTTQAYALRYLRPDDAVADLKVMRPDGTYLADKEQNQILVVGGDAVQDAARAALETLDRPSPQVLFEVKVADVQPTEDSNFGLEFGGFDLQGQPTPGSATYAFAGAAIPWYVRLNALVSQGHASVLATPRLMTVNGREADLLIGQSYPIVYDASVFGGQNVQFVDIGVKLRVTPTIGADGSVTAELHPEYSELLGQTPTGYPIVANRKLDATLRVKSDQTIVLGGLMQDASNDVIEKIPGLSDLPIIGKFFQNRLAHRERDEIVFLITPHVIYPGQPVPSK